MTVMKKIKIMQFYQKKKQNKLMIKMKKVLLKNLVVQL